MSKHLITSGDIVSDLWRCVYFSETGMTDPDFLRFYNLSKKSFEELKAGLPVKLVTIVEKEFKKVEDTKLNLSSRREHLLTAAQLLL